MTTIAEVRQKYPQYQDLSDDELGRALHSKYYSDLDYADFSKRVGLAKQELNPAQQAARKAFERSRAERLSEPQRQPRPAMSNIEAASDAGMSALTSLVATPVSGFAGMFGGDVEKVASALTYQPRTIEGQRAIGAVSKPFEWLAKGADYVGGNVAENTGSPAAGAAVNTAIQSIPAILGGRGVANTSRGVRAAEGRPGAKAPAPQRQAGLGGVSPTIEELAAQSKAAYKRASDAGVVITPNSFNTLKNRVNVSLKKDGIDPTLHPQTTAALKRINETKGSVTLDQLETLRKIANDARGGINKADSRMAAKIVDELDGYMDGIGRKDVIAGSPEGFTALKEARNLYSRKSKAEEIARLVKRAEDSAPNFSASGYENALRIQFRQLAMNDKKMRRFTQEEQAAIRKVARGGPVENALRMLGKLAPTGVISGTVGVAAASMLPGGVLLPVAGLASRYGATRMTKSSAMAAEELMRRGPPTKTRPKNALRELQEQTP